MDMKQMIEKRLKQNINKNELPAYFVYDYCHFVLRHRPEECDTLIAELRKSLKDKIRLGSCKQGLYEYELISFLLKFKLSNTSYNDYFNNNKDSALYIFLMNKHTDDIDLIKSNYGLLSKLLTSLEASDNDRPTMFMLRKCRKQLDYLTYRKMHKQAQRIKQLRNQN